MSTRTTVSVLIVNEHAEEVKLATVGFRGFFADCRVDVAYSAADARALASTRAPEWTFILIDGDSLSGSGATLIEDLKRQVVSAPVLLQTDRAGDAFSVQAMQSGADFFLAKQSPAFLSELLFCAKAAVEKRDLSLTATRFQIRHQQLAECLTDVYYELDADGRVLSIGPTVTALLGYAPQELIGSPFTDLFSSEHLPSARYRFNERRSGSRGAHRLPLTLRRKSAPDSGDALVRVEVNARGLYDAHRRFLGTVGLVRAVPQSGQSQRSESHPVDTAQARDAELGTGRMMADQPQALAQSLSIVRDETSRLAEAIREARLVERLTRLVEDLTRTVAAHERLERQIRTVPGERVGQTVNEILEEVLRSTRGVGTEILVEFASGLPTYEGNRNDAIECFRLLLSYARALLAGLGRNRPLLIRTRLMGQTVAVEYLESETNNLETPGGTPAPESADFVKIHALVRALGGTFDFVLPAGGPFRMAVYLPMAVGKPVIDSPQATSLHQPSPKEDSIGSPSDQRTPARTGLERQERRTSSRVATALPARVLVESTSWDGTISDLGLGGVCIALPPDFPPLDRQSVYAVFRTAIGILELHGSASIRPRPATDRQHAAPRQLVVIFHPPKPIERSILASLLEAARDRSLEFSLELQLSNATPLPLSDTVQPEHAEDDRRESIRIPLALPVRLEQADQPEQGRLIARAENISRHGACLLVGSHPDRIRGPVLLHFPPGKTAGHPGPHEPGVPDASLPGRIVWSVPEPAATGGFSGQSSPSIRIGVQFLPLTPYAERELARLIRQHLTSTPVAPAADTSVVTVHRECRNARGQTIVIADDHLRQPMPADTPILVVSPGYGQTARDYATLSLYLAHHRLRVLRYDHSNHLGMSDGELQNTTLRGMQTDLAKVLEFVHHTWPSARIVVLASDLAARSALKMAIQQPVDLLLLLNPVIDVGNLLMAVHGHDLVADYRYGLRRGITNLLGLNVNLDQFVGDMVAGRLTDLASTLEDLRLLRIPLAIITSPHTSSSPLPPSDLPHAFVSALGTQARMLSAPSSLVDESLASGEPPAAFRLILEQIASRLSWAPPAATLDAAARIAILRQRRRELEQTRLHRNLSQISREAMALAHLQQISQLANLHDYRKLLDDLYAFLMPLEPGMTILDAGIGQSDVTRAMLVNHAYRTRQRGVAPERPPLLVGLGKSGDQVYQARNNVQTLQKELLAGKSGGVAALPPLTVSWMRTDWTQALPFQSESVDRIVCNLSLSFVGSPRVTIREWYRVLHPDGRLVFTAFHPGTDLSLLYRRHLRLANQDEFSSQAQPVLHYLGRLREAIRHGILHTFDQAALASLLRQTGSTTFRISPIFDGHAYVAIVGKRISSSSLS
jgi:PAS domain S-box-containing protein